MAERARFVAKHHNNVPEVTNHPAAYYDIRGTYTTHSFMNQLFYLATIATWWLPFSFATVGDQPLPPLVEENGKVSFLSEAPLELIRAKSDRLRGAIDRAQNTFAFAVDIHSFKGFNSDLQREHFHENYMQTEKMPIASFSGKFIDPVDFTVNGSYVVRAKGIFSIHGVQKERIIKGVINVGSNSIDVDAVFTVKLEDHDIKVPKIVYEKIAEEIRVEISIRFKK